MTTLALLHPGHGTTEPSSLVHYLAEPVHVLAVAFAVAVVGGAGILAWRWLAHRR